MISPETLRRFALFAGLDPAVFKEIAMFGDELSLSAGEWLFHEGDDADALYLVLSGSIDLTLALDEKGTRQIDLSTVVEGEALGWSSLLPDAEVYNTGAKAAADARLVKLKAASLRDLMERDHTTGYIIMSRVAQAMAQRLSNLRVQFASLID